MSNVTLTKTQAFRLSQSPAQQRELARRAYRWIQTIKRLNRFVEALEGDDMAEKYAPALDSAHMLNLALEHLDSCVCALNLGGVTLAGDAAYRSAWEVVSNLRDALEHEEEYVSGGGRFQGLATDDWRANGYYESHPLVWSNGEIVSIGFMGNNYRVREVILGALNLESPVRALLASLDDQGTVYIRGPSTEG